MSSRIAPPFIDPSEDEWRSLEQPSYTVAAYEETLEANANLEVDFYAIKAERFRLFTDITSSGGHNSILISGRTFTNGGDQLKVRLLFAKRVSERKPELFPQTGGAKLLDIYFGPEFFAPIWEQLKEKTCFVAVEKLDADWRVTIRTPPYDVAS